MSSMIQKYFAAVTDAPRHAKMPTMANKGIHQFGATVRQGGTGLLVGGVLGAAHAAEGLDIKGRVPADLLLSVAATGVAVSMSDEDFASDARNVASAGFTTFGFRQGYAFVAEKRKAAGAAPAGGFTPLKMGFHGDDFGTEIGVGSEEEDPIVSMSREFD